MAQVIKKYITDDAVDGAKILLENDQAFRSLNSSAAPVDLIKLDAGDALVINNPTDVIISSDNGDNANFEMSAGGITMSSGITSNLPISMYSSATQIYGEGQSGVLQIFEDTQAYYVGLSSPAGMVANFSMVLPGEDGASGDMLVTDGAGNLSFVTPVNPTDVAANKTLSNLDAPVALNQDLKPDSDQGRSIGASDMRFLEVFASTINGGDGNLNLSADPALNYTIYAEAKSITLEGDFSAVAGPNASAPGVMRFIDTDGSNFIALAAPATVAADVTFTLPVADGSAGQVLSTDGAGQLEWVSSQLNDVWERETIVLSAGDVANGYIDLQNEAIDASLMLFADGLAQIFGASYDYTLSVVGGVTRVTFENTFATLVAENDVIVIQYQYAQ